MEPPVSGLVGYGHLVFRKAKVPYEFVAGILADSKDVVGTTPSHPRHEERQTLDVIHLLFLHAIVFFSHIVQRQDALGANHLRQTEMDWRMEDVDPVERALARDPDLLPQDVVHGRSLTDSDQGSGEEGELFRINGAVGV